MSDLSKNGASLGVLSYVLGETPEGCASEGHHQMFNQASKLDGKEIFYGGTGVFDNLLTSFDIC